MRLDALFEQRTVGAIYSSIRSRKQLPFPSGAQFTESAQESAVVDQLAFSPFVYDLITQPIIHFTEQGKERRYSADVFVEYRVPGEETERFMIEAKRQQDIDENRKNQEVRFAAAREWCVANNAMFCLLSETEIKTTYLANIRLLAESRAIAPKSSWADVISRVRLSKDASVASVRSALEANGFPGEEATVAIEQAIIARELLCDLTRPFSEASRVRRPGPKGVRPETVDPFLRILRQAARRAL